MKNYYANISLIIILTMIMVVESQAGATPPSNDNFANAITLVMGDGSTSAVSNNDNATKEAGEPDHAGNLGGCSVWYKFTPTATKVVRFNITDTNFDTLLAVYTGNSVNNLTLVAYNDNGSSNPVFGYASSADLMLMAGTTYYIAVDGMGIPGEGTAHGNFKIALLEYDSPLQNDFASSYEMGTGYKGEIAGTNFNATGEANEPIPYGFAEPSRKTVWYRWRSSDDFSVAFELAENFNAQIGIYTAEVAQPNFSQLTKVRSNIDYASFSADRSKTTFFAHENRTYYIQIESHIGGQNHFGNFQLKYGPNHLRYSASVDSFGHRASVMLFRPSDGTWYGLTTIGDQTPHIRTWGMNGDLPIAADFNGSGNTQTAAVRNENGQKMWYIGNGGSAFQAIPWGLPTDKPIVGDFDRDGRADVGVIRNSATGYLWYIRQSDTGSMRVFNFGMTGDRPVLGDFDGDGYTEVAVVRNTQTGLAWYLLLSDFDGPQWRYTKFAAVQFGTGSDIPVAEDFDGDGKTDVAVFRPSNGVWYILQSSDGEVRSDAFGQSGDNPQPGDYNGDGKADLCVFRPSDGAWYISRPTGVPAQNFYSIHWGAATDIPVSSLSTLSQ